MNLFVNAMNLIKTLNANQKVVIIFKDSILNDKGIYETIYTEYIAEAQLQPIKKIVENLTDTTTRAITAYNIWLVNLTPEIVNAFKSTTIQNTQIKLNNNIVLSVVEKNDLSFNGWIYLKGVENEKYN